MNAAPSMNDVAHPTFVTVKRPPTMLPYDFKQALEDLETMGFVAVAHVAGDEGIVERRPHALGLSALLVQLNHERRVKLPIEEKPSVSKDVSSTAQNGSRIEERPAVSEQGPRPSAFNRGGPAASSRGKSSRACKRAENERGIDTAADAQAGSPLPFSASKVESPRPRTSASADRRVVMRAPLTGSKVACAKASRSPEVRHEVVRGEQSRALVESSRPKRKRPSCPAKQIGGGQQPCRSSKGARRVA